MVSWKYNRCFWWIPNNNFINSTSGIIPLACLVCPHSSLSLVFYWVTWTFKAIVINIWKIFVLFHSSGHRFVPERLFWFTVISGGCTMSASFRQAVGVGALLCHEVTMWFNHQSDDVFFGWRSNSAADSFYHHTSLWQWQDKTGEIPLKTQDIDEVTADTYDSSSCWSVVMDESDTECKTFSRWSIVKVK